MTHDGRRNLDVEYNVLNLPEKVCREGMILVNYRYLSDGTKLSCLDSQGEGYEYLGSLVYERKGGHLRLESTPFSGGRFVAAQTDSPRMLALHHISDHLGSTRVVVDSCGMVRERNDYYAFGKRWDDPDRPVSDNRYLFNGKEAQIIGATGWLDYGARMYDPELGRWFAPDPLAEAYCSTGLYTYCLNNPTRYIDADGKSPYYNRQGQLVRVDDKGFTGEIYIIESDGEVVRLKESSKLSLEVQSNIYTDVLNHMQDIDYSNLQEGQVSITTSRAVNGKRVTYNDPYETTSRYSTSRNDKNEIVVTAKENLFKTDLYHVEVIQNYLGVHEYIGHGIKGYSDRTKTHWRAYDLQLKDPTFKFMPEEQQNEVRKNRKDYMRDEDPSRYKREYGDE